MLCLIFKKNVFLKGKHVCNSKIEDNFFNNCAVYLLHAFVEKRIVAVVKVMITRNIVKQIGKKFNHPF